MNITKVQEINTNQKSSTIPKEIAEILKSYVYIYIDPRNGEPFYIGKGKGNRLFTHLDEQSDTKKVTRIAQII